MDKASETVPGTHAGGILRSRYLQALAFGALAGVILSSALAGVVAALIVIAAHAYRDRLARPARPVLSETLPKAVIAAGADYAGFSACDGKAIGYDVARRRIVFAIAGRDGSASVSEHPLDAMRGYSWKVEEPDQSNVYGVGPAALAGAVQAASLNAAARRQALLRSGLTIELADVAVPVLHICMDGDETRLRRWLEILTQAQEGTLSRPPEPMAA